MIATEIPAFRAGEKKRLFSRVLEWISLWRLVKIMLRPAGSHWGRREGGYEP